MKKAAVVFAAFLCAALHANAQYNLTSTNIVAEQVMMGNYNPASYAASVVLNDPDTISKGILAQVSPDSMKSYLMELRKFKNRNTSSDTVSSTKGIGAARRWIYSKFQQFSAQSENRLLPSYLQFDTLVCTQTRHRNVFAVLPGSDLSDKSIIIIEGHMDSRCSDNCDTACLAEGMEDNGSGTALVMELARVMSKFTYKHTIVFTTVTGEEQGLLGARAFAKYAQQQGITIKAVMNNDVVGGIICGQTSSPPSCPGLNAIDSTQVRLFSFGGFNSPHKGLSRFIKLEYKEMIRPLAIVPMTISIMTDEDRIGRGGDHIPFRQRGFTAMRFTSANEHGDASNGPGYTDRQHTSSDILGVDTDFDTVIDSFFVDFNYLARNAVINGNAAGMIAIGPKSPDFNVSSTGLNDLTLNIIDPVPYNHYRIGLRTATNDWDSVYTVTGGLTHTLTVAPGTYSISVMSVDADGIESLPSRELTASTTGINDPRSGKQGIELLQNVPNPAGDEATMISVLVHQPITYKEAQISITDITGREVFRKSIELKTGMNELMYQHGYGMSGIYTYSLLIDGRSIQSKKMIFR
ncbi:M28 family peptidase [Polluticoccus soli]|uniref:M28 family peptidase n=1 Tax=Polluticoccus soli TaxID=3034150 RepID=UPI0023E10D14|nr:M28 family peptidase [Flavipsychrobacter sp. JY13-12]